MKKILSSFSFNYIRAEFCLVNIEMYFFVILESLRFVFEFTDSAQFILTELHSFPDLWLNLPQVIGWTVLPVQTKWNRDDRCDWGGGNWPSLWYSKDYTNALKFFCGIMKGFTSNLVMLSSLLSAMCEWNMTYIFSVKSLLKRVSILKYQKWHGCLIVLWTDTC